MENNEQKSTPFLKRVSDIEKRIDLIEKRLSTILLALKTRR
jgi:uncharacterized protein Yka (UPF0111/DUF47 family)